MIDNCPHTIDDIVSQVIPKYVSELAAAPLHDMVEFSKPKAGVATIASNLSYTGDFMGLYVLFDGDSPEYVGISKGVLGRLRQHVCGKTHFDASLAFRMACAQVPIGGKRAEKMKSQEFLTAFEAAKGKISCMKVRTLPVDDAVSLYMLEVWVAMALGTAKWNTFRTH